MPGYATQPASPRISNRGRPSVIDGAVVAEKAFRLWSERGYADTSWADLAAVTGISSRTLSRHFASKAEIAWIGVAPATSRLREALNSASRSLPVSDAIRSSIAYSVSHDPRIRRIVTAWLRLISGEPELVAMAPAAYAPWIDELAGFIHGRIPAASVATCRAISAAYQAATFSALLEWAQTGADGDPADAVDILLGWLDIRVPTPSTL